MRKRFLNKKIFLPREIFLWKKLQSTRLYLDADKLLIHSLLFLHLLDWIFLRIFDEWNFHLKFLATSNSFHCVNNSTLFFHCFINTTRSSEGHVITFKNKRENFYPSPTLPINSNKVPGSWPDTILLCLTCYLIIIINKKNNF